MTVEFNDAADFKHSRVSSTLGVRRIDDAWVSSLGRDRVEPKNVHFLVLPAYTRHNPAAPLQPMAERETPVRRDLLTFPLGYAHVMGSLRSYTNHKIEVVDPYVEYVDMRALDTWLMEEYKKRDLPSPDYVLFGGMSTSWPIIKKAALVVRALFPNAKLVCGGTVANLHYDLLLKDLGIDIAMIGDAEMSAAELFSNLDDYSGVPGIAYLDDKGEIVRTGSPPRQELDDLPEPDFDAFATHEYINSGRYKVGFAGLPINSSTGCPFACRFCYVPGGRSMNYLSPHKIVDRIARLKDKFGIDFVTFNDDILFVHKDHMEELGREFQKADLGVMWTCVSRVNLFSEKDKPLLKMLHGTGLTRMSFGIETGSDKILKNMGKTGVNPDKARTTLRLVRDVGIRATASMLFGFPGETPETIRETVEFCKDNLLYPSFYLLQPFPGTDVYDKYVSDTYDVKAYLELLADYRDGEQIPINLTEMDDETLMRMRREAEAEMQRFHFSNYVAYYGWKTPRYLMRDAILHAKRVRRGSVFLTP